MKFLVSKSFLFEERYSEAIEFVDILTHLDKPPGEIRSFFGRARNEISSDEIKTAIRKQASRFLTAHVDVSLHSLVLMHCDDSAARMTVVLRDLMGDIERFLGQSLYWWGAVYECGEDRHVQAIILGRDELGDLVQLREGAIQRLAANAGMATGQTSIMRS